MRACDALQTQVQGRSDLAMPVIRDERLWADCNADVRPYQTNYLCVLHAFFLVPHFANQESRAEHLQLWEIPYRCA